MADHEQTIDVEAASNHGHQGHQDYIVGEYKGRAGANSRFTDGLYINSFLVPPIRLVKGSFIFDLYRQNKKLLKRQELEELSENPFWNQPITRHTNVIVLSYGWLSEGHPDPDGFHLSRLGPLLKSFHDSQENKKREKVNKRYEGDVAVFMDFLSLFQDDTNGSGRETWQYHAFHDSLKHMPALFANGRTWKWCMTKMPPGDDRPYEGRGWCYFEKSIASIASTSKKILDTGALQFNQEAYRKKRWQDIASDQQLGFDEQVETNAKVLRKPPIFPEKFSPDVMNVDKYTFTAGHDREKVCKMYETTFSQIVDEIDRLEFKALGWDFDDAVRLAPFLRICKKLQHVHLRGNHITDAGAKILIESIPNTLKFLDLRENGISFEFEDDPTDGEIWNSSLPDDRKRLRTDWRKRYFEALRTYYKCPLFLLPPDDGRPKWYSKRSNAFEYSFYY